MTITETSALSAVGDTLLALVATYLGTQSQDIPGHFANVLKDQTGMLYFNYQDKKVFVAQRERGEIFATPGVNIYLGDPVAIPRRDLPQRWRLPIFIHVMMEYTKTPLVGGKAAKRVSVSVENAFRGGVAIHQLYDFTSGTPVVMAGQKVSWAKSLRGNWKELGSPTSENFTNRMWNFEVLYAS